MILGVSIYEILSLTTILFFIGIYGFFTRKNLISVLMSIELILNATVVNFVVINKLLYKLLDASIFCEKDSVDHLQKKMLNLIVGN